MTESNKKNKSRMKNTADEHEVISAFTIWALQTNVSPLIAAVQSKHNRNDVRLHNHDFLEQRGRAGIVKQTTVGTGLFSPECKNLAWKYPAVEIMNTRYKIHTLQNNAN